MSHFINDNKFADLNNLSGSARASQQNKDYRAIGIVEEGLSRLFPSSFEILLSAAQQAR